MKKNMSFKIIATVGLWAAIGLTACKAPQLSPDGERAVLPEGDGHTYDTAFVKPLEWNVFFQDSILQGYVEVALQNNYFQAKHGTGDNEPGQPATGKRLAIT